MKTIANILSRAHAMLLAVLAALLFESMGRFAFAGQRGAVNFSTTLRTARIQAIITAAGASAKMKFYNGTRPANLGAVTGGNTLLATITFGSTIGTATSGALDWDEAGATQTSSGFTAGTPTFVDITTSADGVVFRIDIGGAAPKWDFTGAIATGQNITLTALSLTDGNA